MSRLAWVVIAGACLGACFFDLPDPKPGAEDAGEPVDAAEDGVVPEASTGPCSEPHLLCDDFDRGPLGAVWSEGLKSAGGATMVLDEATSTSGSRSARARMPAGAGTSMVYLEHAAPLDDRGVRLELSVFIVEAGATENYAIAMLSFAPRAGDAYQTAGLFVTAEDASLSVQTPKFASFHGTKIPTGRWVRLRLDAAQRKSGGFVVLSLVDGGSATELVRADGLSYDVQPGTRSVSLRLGPERYDLPTPEIDVRYDDVTFDPIP